MPIVIKEIVVKTTVEKNNLQSVRDEKELIDSLKQRVLSELRAENRIKEFGYSKSDGKRRR